MDTIKILLLISFCSFAAAQNEEETTNCPLTIQEIFDRLDQSLPEEEKEKLRETKEDDLIMLHMGFGMGIRNEYCLWEDTELTKRFRSSFVDHPDSMSGIIIENYWRHVKGEAIDADLILPQLRQKKIQELKDALKQLENGERPHGIEEDEVDDAIKKIKDLLSASQNSSVDTTPVSVER